MAMVTVINRTSAIMLVINVFTRNLTAAMTTPKRNTNTLMLWIMLTAFALIAMIAKFSTYATTIVVVILLVLTAILLVTMFAICPYAVTNMFVADMLTLYSSFAVVTDGGNASAIMKRIRMLTRFVLIAVITMLNNTSAERRRRGSMT